MNRSNPPLTINYRANNLLRVLKEQDAARLIPHFKEITVEAGQVLYEPGDNVKHAYFPCDQTLVSFHVLLEDGRGVEAGLIGREGAVGGIVSQGRLPAYCRAIVQFPGKILRIESILLEEAKMESVEIRHLFARYADCLLSQIFQSVACNATHTIEQRTAKWLVAAIERTGEHVIPLQQDQLANMLGVGRSYISRVISILKSRGIVQTSRSKLHIHSVDGLKALACGCNDMVNQHFETVLSGVYPQAPE